MQLSAPENRSVWIMGLAGFGTFALYQLGSIFIKQSCDDIKLDPETERVQTHSILLSLFVQLGEHRRFCNKSYRRAVIAADELMVLAHQAQSKSIQVGLDDMAEAISLQDSVRSNLQRLSDRAMEQGFAREAAQIYNLATKVYAELQPFYLVVHRTAVNK